MRVIDGSAVSPGQGSDRQDVLDRDALSPRACVAAALEAERRGAWDDVAELATYGLDAPDDDVVVRLALLRALARAHAHRGRRALAADLFARARRIAEQAGMPVESAACVADEATVQLSFIRAAAGQQARIRQALGLLPAQPALPDGEHRLLRARLLALLAVTQYFDDLGGARASAGAAHDLLERLGGVAGEPGADLVRAVHGLVSGAAGTDGVPLTADVPGPRDCLYPGWPAGAGLLRVARLSRAACRGDRVTVARLAPGLVAHDNADVAGLAAVVSVLWRLHSAEHTACLDAALATLPTAEVGRLLQLGAAAAQALHDGAVHAPRLARLVEPWRNTGPREDLTAGFAHCMLALAGGLLGDVELCRRSAASLAEAAGEFVTLAGLVVVGPSDWYRAWALEGLGDHQGALAANAVAVEAAQAAGAVAWVAQGLLQQAILLRSSAPVAARRVAREAAALAATVGLDALETKASELCGVSGVPGSAPVGTTRHGQVLELAARGFTNEEIATQLGLSISTVQRHFTAVFRGLGARNRAEAVAVMRAAGPSAFPDPGWDVLSRRRRPRTATLPERTSA